MPDEGDVMYMRSPMYKYTGFMLLLFSLNLNAAVNSGHQTITQFEVTNTFFTLYFGANIPNDGCEDRTKVVFWADDYPKGYASMLSTALAAYISGKQISMFLHNCKDGPWGSTLPFAQSINVH